MNIGNFIGKFIKRKSEPAVVFLSVLLDVDSVSAAVWTTKNKGLPSIIKTVTRPVKEDSWEERTDVLDDALSILDETVHPAKLRSVVLGLPAAYLTHEGEILPEIRKEIKKFTKALGLTPIGFVPSHQAIAHTLRRDEGVPPTVILISVSSELTISLYKVGNLVGQSVVDGGDDVALHVEKALKELTGQDILPSRILLFGSNHDQLSSIQALLLRHPWQTRANFLHFPKIEFLPIDFAVAAVSVAGATELSQEMGEDTEVEEEMVLPSREELVTPPESSADQTTDQEDVSPSMEEMVSEDVAGVPETREESNVVMVEPEVLGFERKDVSELQKKPDERMIEDGDKEPQEPIKRRGSIALPRVSLPRLPRMSLRFPALPVKNGVLFIGGGLIFLLALFWLVRWVVPHARVTLFVIPQTVSASETVTIEPTATVVSSEQKIVPGRKQEQSVSGEKTAPVTGKKKVGDPAKGTVTIFNKSTSSRSFKKGSIIVANALSFALDDDVQIASASENLVSGTVTFGKVSGNVTAAAIGTQSNLPAGTEFTFKDISASVAIARSDKAFAGGSSKDITVVSRADYDALTKVLTDELVQKAKQELSAVVSQNEKLIDETIKTTIAEKTFTEEIDQEAQELHGSLRITVSGISFHEDDIKELLTASVASSVPSGYTLDQESLSVTIAKAELKKDGTIVIAATLSGRALPAIDSASVQSSIASKSIEEAQQILKRTSGVGGVEFFFSYSFTKSHLPVNKNNISVIIVAQ